MKRLLGVLAVLGLGVSACAADRPAAAPASPEVTPRRHLVVPLVFVPTDYRQYFEDDVVRGFYQAKVAEAQRFFYLHNGHKTFAALPVEVVSGRHDHLWYWGETRAFEYNVLLELQERGYPVHVDWDLFPSDRVVWVLAMGSGGWAGGRHYPVGGGFAMWGDALLFAGMDLRCERVQPVVPGDHIHDTCRDVWFPNGQIYGFGVGAAIHELGHGFNLPHPPDGSPDWSTSIMGSHWNYPATGLSDSDRAILASSPFLQEPLP
jgi:hypothetical protein